MTDLAVGATKTAAYWRFPRPSGAIGALDGLRAIAVLLVLLRHAAFPVVEALGGPAWPLGGYDLATPLINGWIGVDLFFVLSGFLIAGQLLRLEQRPGGLRYGPYLTKRLLRIYPTYLFVLLLVAAGAFPLYQVNQADLVWRLGYHLAMLQDYLPSDFVVAFWSLGVEEKFYLFAPLLLGLGFFVRHPRRRLWLLTAAVLLPLLLRLLTALSLPGPIDYVTFFRRFRSPFHCCLDALAIGMIAALLYRRAAAIGLAHVRRQAQCLAWGSLAAIVALLCATPLLATITLWDETLQPTVIAVAFGALLLGAALGGGPRRLLESASLGVIARISYPLYLVHLPLLPLAWVLAGGTAVAPPLQQLLPIFLLLSGLAALLVHFLVEKPFLLLKDRVGRDTPRQAVA